MRVRMRVVVGVVVAALAVVGGGSPPVPAEEAPASIDIVKVATVPVFEAGDVLQFDITVTSGGPGTATGVTVTDELPDDPGLSWTTEATDDALGCSIASNELACEWGDLASGQARTVSIVSGTTSATTDAVCAEAPGVVDNTAQVTTTNAGTDEDDAEIRCDPPGSIDIVKDVASPVFEAGDTITFDITTTSTGPGPAQDVVVTDALPTHPGLSWSITEDASESCAIASGTLTCDYGDLPSGTVRVVQISSPTTGATTDDVCAGSPGTVDNTAVVTTSNAGSDDDDADSQCDPVEPTLGVTLSGTGNGRVTGPGIDCRRAHGSTTGDCTQTYAASSEVELVAARGRDTVFGGWGKSCNGSTYPTCTITMDTDRLASARFDGPPRVRVDATIDHVEGTAKFTFVALGGPADFRCRLLRDGRVVRPWTGWDCGSPRTYRRLARVDGYTFGVQARADGLLSPEKRVRFSLAPLPCGSCPR